MSKTRGQRELGWWTAGMLLILAVPAWGLDLDHSIRASEREAVQIASKIGRTHQMEPAKPQPAPKKDKAEMRVALIHKHKHHSKYIAHHSTRAGRHASKPV